MFPLCLFHTTGLVSCLLPRYRRGGNENRPDFVTPLFAAHDKDTKLSGWGKTGAFFGLVLITTHHYLPVIAYNPVFEINTSPPPSSSIPAANLSLHRQSGSPSAAVHSKSCIFFIYFTGNVRSQCSRHSVELARSGASKTCLSRVGRCKLQWCLSRLVSRR